MTYMHMPDVSDADKHSLARLGELDVFMERTGKRLLKHTCKTHGTRRHGLLLLSTCTLPSTLRVRTLNGPRRRLASENTRDDDDAAVAAQAVCGHIPVVAAQERHSACANRNWVHADGRRAVLRAGRQQPVLDGTNECWNDVIPRIRSFHYGQLVF